jgi:PKD domain-containing protein/invasin-like protein
MQTMTTGLWRAGATLLLAGSLAACTVDKQEAPSLIGPGGSAQSLTLAASPDRVAHNGSAQSVVTVRMLNESGAPLAGQRVSVTTSTGSTSHVDVVTGTDGQAFFVVTAPSLSTPAGDIVVFATPFGINADNALTRSLSIALTGTPVNKTAPTAAFTFEPAAPEEGGAIVFDASTTTDEGQECGTRCTYSWNFGGLGAGSTQGMTVSRNALVKGTYAVTLTVTDNAGTVSNKTRAVTVVLPAAAPEE